MPIVIGLLLMANGLVHFLCLVENVPEFSLEGSWLVPSASSRAVAQVLIWATAILLVLLGLAVWGVPRLVNIWPGLAIGGSVLSLILLGLFWSWSLVLGVIIDLALIAIAWISPDWADRFLG